MGVVQDPPLRSLSSNLALLDSTKATCGEQGNADVIKASARRDPGYVDYFGTFAGELQRNGDKPMHNVLSVPNDEGKLVAHYEEHPVPDTLIDFNCSWELGQHKRNL